VTRRLLPLVLVSLAACGYSNSMYHANRLSKAAERAEREGRRYDASNYWGQAVVKADTVLAREPRSPRAADAHFVRGNALAQLGQCSRAVPSLEQARLRTSDVDRQERATALLAGCRLATGDTVGAAALSALLLESRDPERRAEARFRLGVAHVRAAEYARALAVTDSQTTARARHLRLVALAGLGRTDAVLALTDSLVEARDSTVPWQAVVERLAAHDPAGTSSLVDRVVAAPGTRPEARVRWLSEDAARLATRDRAAAERRLAELAGLDTRGGATAAASIRLVRARIGEASGTAAVAALATELDSLAQLDSVGLGGAEALQGLVRFVLRAVDSAALRVPGSDMALFVAGEYARDSLAAPRVAAELFRRVVEDWPDSPFAPKALLAGRRVDPAWVEFTQPLVDERYRDSPYLAALRGEQLEAFRALEDSLQTYALEVARAESERRGRTPSPGRAGAPGLLDPEAGVEPGARPNRPRTTRPRPAGPGARVRPDL
jgi:hypothetical protein